MPVFTGLVNEENPVFTIMDGLCFKKIVFTYEATKNLETGELEEIRIKVDPQEPKNRYCYDWFLTLTH